VTADRPPSEPAVPEPGVVRPSGSPPVRPTPAAPSGRLSHVLSLAIVPILSVVLALIVAAVLIILSSPAISGHLDLLLPVRAYASLLEGAGIFPVGINGLVNTIVQATPLTLGGLAVGLGFKAGLFNIGAQGQFLFGATGAAAVGAATSTMPFPIGVTLALIAGALAGAAWGFVPGALKAWTGAHEVVTTIMLNAIAGSIVAYLILGPLLAPGYSFSRTGDLGNSVLPIIFGRNLHLGVLVAVIAVPIVWWLLFRSTLGFEIRTVGASPSAARYAGMRPALLIILTMSMSGLLAGVAGATEILGISHFMIPSYGTSIGFDSISIALLGRAHPFGIVFAALLFGALRAGAGLMQIQAQIPVEIVDVIQAIILLFIAADVLVRKAFHIRAARSQVTELETVTKSYGSQAAR
jgi:simple sugar transport system permease protein